MNAASGEKPEVVWELSAKAMPCKATFFPSNALAVLVTFVANVVHLVCVSETELCGVYVYTLRNIVGYAVAAVSEAIIVVEVGFVPNLYRL